jgi:hypothetical protein
VVKKMPDRDIQKRVQHKAKRRGNKYTFEKLHPGFSAVLGYGLGAT